MYVTEQDMSDDFVLTGVKGDRNGGHRASNCSFVLSRTQCLLDNMKAEGNISISGVCAYKASNTWKGRRQSEKVEDRLKRIP